MQGVLKAVAVVVYFVVGLWGFVVCLAIVVENFSFVGGIIAFSIFPVTLIFAPWYEALANGNWFPVLLVYGGGTVATILYGWAFAIGED